MSKQIYKYKLNLVPEQVIQLPVVEILDIQLQNGITCLWAVIDTNRPDDIVHLYMFGTGTPDVDIYYDYNDLTYLSTIQFDRFVFHWFYKII